MAADTPLPCDPAHSLPRPWGPWLTLLFGVVLLLGYATAQGLFMIPLPALYAAGGTPPARVHEVGMSGFNFALATLGGCPVMVMLCGLVGWARRGPTLGEYFAVRTVTLRGLIGWVLLIVAVGCGLSILNDVLERPPPEFIVDAFASAGDWRLFWAAIVVCAPVAEETLFRGFLYAGWASSRMGPTGAILVTTVLFTLIHAGQYGWVDLVQLSIIGLCLGIARARSGSILPSVAMHIALNFTSLLIYAATRGVR